MKEFWQTMEKDIQKENFTKNEWLVYGVIAPMALVLVIALISLLEEMVNNNLL